MVHYSLSRMVLSQAMAVGIISVCAYETILYCIDAVTLLITTCCKLKAYCTSWHNLSKTVQTLSKLVQQGSIAASQHHSSQSDPELRLMFHMVSLCPHGILLGSFHHKSVQVGGLAMLNCSSVQMCVCEGVTMVSCDKMASHVEFPESWLVYFHTHICLHIVHKYL